MGFRERMASKSGVQSLFGGAALPRPSVLFAHDATQSTCSALLEHIERFAADSGRCVRVATSAQDAAEQLRSVRRQPASTIDLAILCLDLQPVPVAGTRLAEFALHVGVPVVLVTRSMHWLSNAPHLSVLRWLRPDAQPSLVAATLGAAIAEFVPRADDDFSGDRVSVGF